MTYRNPDNRRRDGGDASRDFAWPWHYPQAEKPAWAHCRSRPAPHIESWDDAINRPRATANGQWHFSSPPATTAKSFSSQSTPDRLGFRQPGAAAAWKRNGAAGAEGGSPEAPASSSGGHDAIPVELALKGLYEALSSCKGLCEAYEHAFQEHAGRLTPWAAESTLDKLWRDMIARRDDAARFQAVAERVGSRLSSLKTALRASRAPSKRGRTAALAKQNPVVIERRLRAAKKAELHCEEVLGLTGRARVERVACRLLVEEAGELMAMLDPRTHFMLYHDSEEEKAEGMKSKEAPAQTRQNGKTKSRGSWKENAEEREREKEKEKEPEVDRWGDAGPELFGQPAEVFQEGEGDDEGGGAWIQEQTREQQPESGGGWI